MTTPTQIEELKPCAQEAQNTDRELWRTTEGDYYSKHNLFVTKDGWIGLCEGGHCITMPPENWFSLAQPDAALAQAQERAPTSGALASEWMICHDTILGFIQKEFPGILKLLPQYKFPSTPYRSETIPSTPSSPSSLSDRDETAWLVEKGGSGPPEYITANDFSLTWTTDVNQALRLARRADAEAISELCDDAWHVVEHAWQAPSGKYIARSDALKSSPEQKKCEECGGKGGWGDVDGDAFTCQCSIDYLAKA